MNHRNPIGCQGGFGHQQSYLFVYKEQFTARKIFSKDTILARLSRGYFRPGPAILNTSSFRLKGLVQQTVQIVARCARTI
jgi:hypothetical protein